MKSKNVLVPVKRIIKIINSCQNDEQIESCKTLVNNYVKSARKNNVINTEDFFYFRVCITFILFRAKKMELTIKVFRRIMLQDCYSIIQENLHIPPTRFHGN